MTIATSAWRTWKDGTVSKRSRGSILAIESARRLVSHCSEVPVLVFHLCQTLFQMLICLKQQKKQTVTVVIAVILYMPHLQKCKQLM